jgi:protocatechuate 3,4-dioxygenase beta subunit
MAYADAAGKFTVTGLAPGTYRPSVAGWGGAAQAWVLASKTTVTAGTTNLRLVAVKGLSIVGVVVDEDGKPLAGAWIHASDPKDENSSHGAQTKADGAFEIVGLEKGRAYSLRATMQTRATAKIENVEVGAPGIKLVLAKGLTSSGRVVDAAGKGLSRVHVAFTQAGAKEDDDTKGAQTDEDGAFTVAGLAPGAYDAKALVAKPDGGNEWKPCGTLKAGDSNVELRVQP